ncbi:MAG TPA: RnfH family protein [Gammaproteobacteria bacterium]|nr:RnfH family protein [Gammaproteobacteria bacterium]HIM05229.1 RnfH family protein [Gammaproteobacteria bacterium]
MRLLDGPSRYTVSVDLLEVEVVYARPEEQVLIQVSVPAGSTARDAIVRSNILSETSGLDVETLAVGIFARRVTLDYILKAGDRVEIYRPLTMSPVEARRWRAKLKTPQLD